MISYVKLHFGVHISAMTGLFMISLLWGGRTWGGEGASWVGEDRKGGDGQMGSQEEQEMGRSNNGRG